MISLLFQSRSPEFRSPVGAVKSGTDVQICIKIDRTQDVRSVFLWFSQDGFPAREVPMRFVRFEGLYRVFEGTVMPETAGLYWYTFGLLTSDGMKAVGRDSLNAPVISENPAAWQMTVYDAKADGCRSWAGAMMYQIFPDRFARSGRLKRPVGKEYATLKKTEELPRWQREENGDLKTDDFFGGNLKGIEEKLDYLQSLGVTVLYLNPIFLAHSNHRYDTADYEKIDPFLGTEEDFQSLCHAVHRRGMKLILDGVFSHTGDDSVYFNRYGTYPSVGAYQSKDSPYANWYRFTDWPDSYAAWWGVKILPEVEESHPDYLKFITGENGILRRWLRLGADGWRLDVADELPDVFLDAARRAVKAENPEALLLGEVWEDATNKIAYSARRRYLLGDQLDGVMNYQMKNALLEFLAKRDSVRFAETLESWQENYPPFALRCSMNLLGTHDTRRILSMLSPRPFPDDIREQAQFRLTGQDYAVAVSRLKLAYALLFFLPGIPSVYYGDEAGMQGGNDPLNRAFFPWDTPDSDLTRFVARLGRCRKENAAFADSKIDVLAAEQDFLLLRRRTDANTVYCAVNLSDDPMSFERDAPIVDLMTGTGTAPRIGARSFLWFTEKEEE